MSMHTRVRKLLPKLKARNLGAFLVSSPYNISYLADYKCRDSWMLVTADGVFYFTDSRYTLEMRTNLKGIHVVAIRDSAVKTLAGVCRRLKIARLGFEERQVSYVQYSRLHEQLAPAVALEPVSGLVEALRSVKDRSEIARIRHATEITVKAYRFIKEILAPGMKEIEVAGELERFIRYQGASCASFDIIVASGPNSSFPHHLTSSRVMQPGEPVMIDMGVEYEGYKSDLTRVFFLGKLYTLGQKVYQAVLTAQKRAIAAIKPGVSVKTVDKAARDYLKAQGLGKFFLHSLGHGVGLEVHEAPGLTGLVDDRLLPGQVVTVEPAVYLPGKFGIRIEDLVLVTSQGCEVLSGALNK